MKESSSRSVTQFEIFKCDFLSAIRVSLSKKLRNPGNRFNAHNQSWNICWPDGLIKLVRSNIAVLWWHAHSIVTGHCSSTPVTIAMRLLAPSLYFNSLKIVCTLFCAGGMDCRFFLETHSCVVNGNSINFKGYSL